MTDTVAKQFLEISISSNTFISIMLISINSCLLTVILALDVRYTSR